MIRTCYLAGCCLALLLAFRSQAADVGIRAPDGFEVSVYADDELAHDIFSMTINARGQVVVAGPGYVKVLHDTDDDGRADKATLFSEFPTSGAQGMLFLGNDLIATGDNLLMRLRDKDGDGVADGRPIPLANVRSPEHGAHGLVQGPDGWIYMICGNNAGVGSQLARTKRSPVKKPQAGTVVRFSPDFKRSEIYAHGFRNPYDLAFNAGGQLFTVDSDGERDQYLPWYAPTRLFDIQQGMHHGWVQRGWTRSWNRPECFFDNVPRLVEIGRGSPTGVACYRHYAFPSHWRGGIYSCCWTLGTVYYFPLTRAGASYKSHQEVFLQTTGEVGFAPVDLAVGPDGDMFVAIGGRGTRGSVFRVRYTGELNEKELQPEAKTDLEKVLHAPQPLSAWSRAKWMPLAEDINREILIAATLNTQLSASERIRALEIVKELYGGLPLFVDRTIFSRASQDIAARAIWALGDHNGDSSTELEKTIFAEYRTNVSAGLGDRAFWEAYALRDLSIRRATYPLARRAEMARLLALNANADLLGLDGLRRLTLGDDWHLMRYGLADKLEPHHFPQALELFQIEPQDADEAAPDAFRDPFLRRDIDPIRENMKRIDLVRVLELCLGDIRVEPTLPDVYAGYTANAPEEVSRENRQAAAQALGALFPAEDADLNREIARTMGMLEVEGKVVSEFAEKLTNFWTLKSSVPDDIHYLIVLSRLPGERTAAMTEKTAGALAFLHYKMLLGEMYPSRNWPLRVGETFVELCRRDPKLAEALATHREFGLPQHAMFAKLMPAQQRKIAGQRLLEKAQQADDDLTWTPAMIELVAELDSEEAATAIREQWYDFALRDAIIAAIYCDTNEADRALFIAALDATDQQTVARAAEALTSFDKPGSPSEIAAALTALRHYGNLKDGKETRQALATAIKKLARENFAFDEEKADDPLAAYRAAFAWFAKAYPEEAAKMNRLAALDDADWPVRLTKINWSRGDVSRGKDIFSARSCSKCHSGRNRLGPELEGVTSRWSREDLIKEIVDPNRNVAPQFLTSRLVTSTGKVYDGVPIYQSPDGTLLQTGPDETIRIAGPEVLSISRSRTSLMPTGLLRGLSDEEIADLYAYLKTLSAKSP